jgi:methionine-rich copper-binding protein CopC
MRSWTVAALAIAVCVVAMPALPALGHADYDSSLPARDEVLPEAPARVEVFFTQEVFRQEGSNFVRVFDESGAQVSDGDGVIDDDDRAHITAELQPGLGGGRYIVRWKTLSDADGDEDEGAFCFYVGVEPTAEQEAECAAFTEEEPTPTEGATATTSTPAAAAPTPTAASPTADDDNGGVSTVLLVIAGIVGVAIVVTVGGAAIVWFRRAVE